MSDSGRFVGRVGGVDAPVGGDDVAQILHAGDQVHRLLTLGQPVQASQFGGALG